MFAAIIILIVALDQFTKYLAVEHLAGQQPFALIDGVFEFSYHENSGAIFGSFSNSRWVFMTVSTVAIIAMLVLLIMKFRKEPLIMVSLSMLIGGGIGNMIDRIRLGYVVDFLYAKFIDFPIFNIADSFVTIGSGLLILYLIKTEIKDRREKRLNAPEAETTTTNNTDNNE